MNRALGSLILIVFIGLSVASSAGSQRPVHLSQLQQGEQIADFAVANLYADADDQIVGAKFIHKTTGAPIYILQIDTTPPGLNVG